MNKLSKKLANDVYDKIDDNEEENMIRNGYSRDSDGNLINKDGLRINAQG